MAPTDARVAKQRAPSLLVLAPDPQVPGHFPGPIGRIAYSLVDALRGAGCRVETEVWGRHAREESRLTRVTGRARDLLRIRRKIASRRFDVVFVNTTHDTRALTRDLLLMHSLPRRVRWVFLYHGSKPDWLLAPGLPRFTRETRMLVRRSSAILVLSNEEARQWKAFAPVANVRVVTNPFTPAPALESASGPRAVEPGGKIHLMFSGRLMPEKGLYDLLEAMALVVPQADCTLLIAGEGEIEGDLRRRAAELGLQDKVEFLGFLDQAQLGEVYARSDMLVLPSYYAEGFPTVISEAMSRGLPVVTTPIRGAADHLVEGENVLFVPPHAPREVADADPEAGRRRAAAPPARREQPRQGEGLRSRAGRAGLPRGLRGGR